MASNKGDKMHKVRFTWEGVEEGSEGNTSSSQPKTPFNSERDSSDASSGRSLGSKALRGNLTREQRNRDPLFYYEIISVLGAGSMGSVVKVRKRKETVGGSARKDLQDHFRKEKRLQDCFSIPLLGNLFHFCFKMHLEYKESQRSLTMQDDSPSRSRTSSAGSSILQTRTNIVEDYNDQHGEPGNELVYAMKSIHLSRVTNESFIEELKNEIDILKSLDHPHIVKAIETFEYRNQIFVVMELCWGGDLYCRDPYTEAEAARIVSSILSAISYMHSKNFCHRDLKYENILFSSTSPKAEIKLIDFGLSTCFGQENMKDGVGTIYTMAPEVFKRSYTKQADIWSVGVIAYMLLSSQMPFYGNRRRQMIEKIKACKYDFKGRRWKRISQQAKDFVSDLLVLDPDERPTADEAFRSPWLNTRHVATVRNPLQEEIESAHGSIINYSKYSKLKKVALMLVAHKSTSEEIGILRKIFQKYDTEKNGHLSFSEFSHALCDAGYSTDEIRQVFDSLDLDGSGKIRYTEFLASTIEAQGAIDERRLAEAFDRLDSDDSGYITKDNLREILGEDFPQSEIDAIIKESDMTKDGRISYFEFLAQWEDHAEAKRSKALHSLELQPSFVSITPPLSPLSESEYDVADDDQLDIVGRATFLENKQLSERKVATAQGIPIEVVIQHDYEKCASLGWGNLEPVYGY